MFFPPRNRPMDGSTGGDASRHRQASQPGGARACSEDVLVDAETPLEAVDRHLHLTGTLRHPCPRRGRRRPRQRTRPFRTWFRRTRRHRYQAAQQRPTQRRQQLVQGIGLAGREEHQARGPSTPQRPRGLAMQLPTLSPALRAVAPRTLSTRQLDHELPPQHQVETKLHSQQLTNQHHHALLQIHHCKCRQLARRLVRQPFGVWAARGPACKLSHR